jgi:hypothetical protein
VRSCGSNNVATQFFVVGSGRCGSTLLSNLLRTSDQVLSLSEVLTVIGGRKAFEERALAGPEMWELLSRPQPDMMALLRRGAVPEVLIDRAEWLGRAMPEVPPLLLIPLPHLCDDPATVHAALRTEVLAYPVRSPAQHLAQVFEWLGERFGRRTWIERSGGSSTYVELLVAHFPRAKFVHLLRDGRDCALSMSRHPLFRLRMARYLTRDDDLDAERGLDMDIPLDRFAAFWSALMIHARVVLSKLDPERVLVLRYEDLCADPAAELERLARFIGVASLRGAEASAIAEIAPRSGGWRALPEHERQRLERACRPGLRELEQLARTP